MGIVMGFSNWMSSRFVWMLAMALGIAAGAAHGNDIQAENALPGNPPVEWDISGAGHPSIQGFATDISVDQGETVRFEVATDSTDYRLDIYRLGYYQGNGARFVDTVQPAAALPQVQPACLKDLATGLIDCGNWAESASWSVPATAVSGVYIAKLIREDGGNAGQASHVVFVVRDDDGESEILLQTSDTTWQAYNAYGGNSLYVGSPVGRAYKVSYNRPFDTRAHDPQDWVFNADYPLIRWLERSGYDVSYTTGVDSDRRGAELLEHEVFVSVGHDEYWSGTQRANVTAARDAGTHLMFLSGNDVFWKTRWENSIDGSGTPNRTLVSYKETHAGAKIDPSPEWTGTWRDPRFATVPNGAFPENALTGTIFTVNCCTYAMQVPAEFGDLRLWRNTSVASLGVGQTATFPIGTLGYEWNEDLDNGFRPPGLIRLSRTTVNVPQRILDHGSTYGPGIATHALTQYRANSGALVFSAGSVQWTWGLDSVHDLNTDQTVNQPADVRMQQATVNLLADMGVSATTLQSDLLQTSASTDLVAPTTTISLPTSGSSVFGGSLALGSAADSGGGVVAGVEVSTDGGTSWHSATGRTSWSYALPDTSGPLTLMARAIDDSGNTGAAAAVSFSIAAPECPCSIWNDGVVPGNPAFNDPLPVNLGLKFRSSEAGYVTGVRFYKGTGNDGTHTGQLWSASGVLLAQVTFANETATGWQTALFDDPVAISADTTYVVSYHAPQGHYAVEQNFFSNGAVVSGSLRALAQGEDGNNGVYFYSTSPGFPNDSFMSSNYFVDVVFDTELSNYTGFGNETPANIDSGDVSNLELGVKFRVLEPGKITAIRFFKSLANTGTHVGTLWTSAGANLGSVAFSNESANGWQEATFATPIDVVPGTTYIASYHAPVGGYSFNSGYFAAADVVRGPIRFLQDGMDGGNGVFFPGGTGFPTATFGSTNYWVDVRFVAENANDNVAPTITTLTPAPGALGVAVTDTVNASFNEPVANATLSNATFELHDASNNLVPATISLTGLTARLQPIDPLNFAASYTATVKGGVGGITDLAGNPLSSDVSWTFTTQTPPPPPPDQGPGGPILVVSGVVDFFGRYVSEILRTEGLNAFDVINITSLDQAQLDAHSVVILGAGSLSAAQITLLTAWVENGGQLVALRPDADLADLLGITPTGNTLSNAYLAVDGSQAPGTGIVTASMQFHGTADLYTLNGARAVALLWSDSNTVISNPAVTIKDVGSNGGKAAAFMFDLARSIVYTRQGNPAWAGQERDGIAPIRSDDLFFGAASGDVQADWIDLNKVAIPQADEQQRLLANLIQLMSPFPLPRFWYLPSDHKAAVVMTGDEHNSGAGTIARFDQQISESPVGCSVDDWECVRSSSYIYPSFSSPLDQTLAQQYHDQGFEIGVHVNTGCSDWTPASLTGFFSSQLANFSSLYPNLPPQSTNRTHCIVWSDWVSHAKVERDHDIRLDTNYYYWPPGWVQNRPGFFTGSGMPMRFADLDGAMIDVYQATSQMTDESNQSFPFTIDTLLDRALGAEGYYGVFTANMHTDYGTGGNGTATSSSIVASALTRGVPVVSGRQMLTWLDARNASSFSNIVFATDTLSFEVTPDAAARNLRALLPTVAQSGVLTALTRNGAPVSYSVETIKGIAYARFDGLAGDYIASYAADTTAPTISDVSVAPESGGVATVTWNTDEAATSTVIYGLTPGNLDQTVTVVGSYTLHSVQLTGLANSTTYFYRVVSADAAANEANSPVLSEAAASFVSAAGQCFIDTTLTDFANGSADAGILLTNAAGGELILTPTLSSDFDGAALPAEFSAVSWGGGSVTVGSGTVTVDGHRVQAALEQFYNTGHALEFVATFRPDTFQHVGLGLTFNEFPFVLFTTGNDGTQVYARTFDSGGAQTINGLGADLLNSAHRYRIEWEASEIRFYVDGVLRATHAVSIPEQLRPMLSDFNANGVGLSVDWLRFSPFASGGQFESQVVDAGSVADWLGVEFDATTPADTTVGVSFRAGNTSIPDGTWSAFVAIPSSGSSAGVTGRYGQYRVQLASANSLVTSELLRVAATCMPIVNVAPVADAQSVNTNEDQALAVTLTATDGNNDFLTYQVVEPPSFGVLTGTAPNLTYTPNGNVFGNDSFTFKANDNLADSNIATVSITVAAVNDAPVAVGDAYVTNEDQVLSVVVPGVLANDTDVDNLSLSAVVSDPPDHGQLQLASDGSFDYTPNENYFGADSFGYQASDGGASSAEATVTLTIHPINDAPVANAQSVTVNEDDSTTITLTGADVDNDPLTFDVVSQPSQGVLSGVAPNLTYTPNGNYFGSDSFSFTVSDASGPSAAAIVTINVTSVNDLPTANDQSLVIDEDVALAMLLTGDDLETPPASLTFSIVNQPANGALSGSGASRIYTPAANFHGLDSFTFVVNDGSDNSAPATVSISVNSVADMPIANPDAYSGGMNLAINVAAPGVLANDSDGDGDTLTAAVSGLPAHGAVAMNANGSFIYTPTIGYCGPDSFTYDASDAVSFATGTVNLTINCGNQAPLVTSTPSTQSVNYSDGVAPILVSATDVDDVGLSITTQWRAGTTGTLKNGLPAGLSLVSNGCIGAGQGATCTWFINGNITEKPATYFINARVNDGDVTVIATSSVVVSKETLTVLSYGPAAGVHNPILFAANGGTVSMQLSARLAEALPDANGAAGNIASASSSLRLVPVSGTTVNGTGCVRVNSGSGYDQVQTVTCNFNNVPVKTYSLVAQNSGSYYTLPTTGKLEDVVTVYDPTQPQSAGGGEFYWPGTAHDSYPGDLVRFGFELNVPNVAPAGTLALFRYTEDGRFYRIRGSAISTLVETATVNGAEATFIVTNASYLRPNANGTNTTLTNRKLYIYADDANQSGPGPDRLWLKLRSSTSASATTYSEISLPDPGATNAVPIVSGEVVVSP